MAVAGHRSLVAAGALAALAALVAGAGCQGYVDRQAAATTYKLLAASAAVAARTPDVELARAALPAGLIQLAAFAQAYPDDRRFATLYADAACEYAVGFAFDDWEDAELAGRPTDALAARATTLLETCRAANRALLPATAAARWVATADAMTIALEPFRHLALLPATLAALRACAAAEPGGHDAAAELLLGTLEAALPGGGDGAARFAAARAMLGEGALLVDVMEARATAVARRDRARFDLLLHRVLDADLARWPERRLANELARVKARRYLAAAPALFP